MDKNAIQKYAIWARNELIGQVKQRAFQYGISDKGYGEENATVINGRVLTSDEKRQRQDFVHEIQKNGFEQAVEEVAYTWFNRFVALRFMEVNDYLPTHVRVFSDASGSFNPEILKDVLHLDLEGLDKAKVSDLLNANQTEDLYRYLLITQCNALSTALPEMFERLGSYTEMFLPSNILRAESIIGRMLSDIQETDWLDGVQIIGWMYQFYNTEPKRAVFDAMKKNVKLTKETIPLATQLYTPDWIVRYLLENSLGQMWLKAHPNDTLKSNWHYYIDTKESGLEGDIKPESIKIIDPCMGSGHILVYAFDMLIKIYRSAGYTERDAAKLILEKNLYGLDIDRRAHQLAYFALMMKAREYNRRIFSENVKPQVYHPEGWDDGEEYGSLITTGDPGEMPQESQNSTLFDDHERDVRIWNYKRLLSMQYDIVVTNPPYMGGKGQGVKMSEFLAEKYADVKSDTFSAFIVRCCWLAKPTGYVGMFTPYVWMFIQSYEKLRNLIYNDRSINSLIQYEYSAFEEATVPVCSFVLRNNPSSTIGTYFRLVDFRGGMEVQRQKFLEAIKNPECGFFYTADSGDFTKIPGCPVAYWVSETVYRIFESSMSLSNIAKPRQGLATSDNDRFLKLWYEPLFPDIGFDVKNIDDEKKFSSKWFPCTKGGSFRRWYGNNDYVVNWENDGSEIKEYAAQLYQNYTRTIKNIPFYFQEGLSWSTISSSLFSLRYIPNGFIFETKGAMCYVDKSKLTYLLALLNTKLTQLFLSLLSPTLDYHEGPVGKVPVIIDAGKFLNIQSFVNENIDISRADWDAFETSWAFNRHPLIYGERTVAAAFDNWEREAVERFNTLKANEEELNRIFIDIYGLQDELTPEVEDKNVTVRRADLGREIRSLISYAVGCIFGRYSLDCEGLAYAGGDWDASKYSTFIPDKDNILPICDDEYFEDDIVGRFVDFIRVAYGTETLEENLKFIADALGGKGTPREVIRSYFLNDFFADHCKIYQKRPIYWLFDSGKKNGFKALVYLHRYSRDLLAKMRTDYVHEQQERYRTQLSHIAAALNTATGAERAKLLKQQDKLAEQLKEITVFEEKVHHLADQNITIDLDDGVKKNYEIFADVLAKI